MEILKIDQIDFNLIDYSETYSSNAKYCHHVRYNKKEFFLKTPPMRIDTLFVKKKIIEIGLEISVELDNFFKELDNKLVNDFKEENGYKVFKVTTKKMLLESGVYSRGLKLKLPNTENFKTLIYNKNKEIIDSSELKINSYIRIGLELSSVWCNQNGVFGLYLKPHQIKLESNKNCHIDNYNNDYRLDEIVELNKSNNLVLESTLDTVINDFNNTEYTSSASDY
uniref:Uncharacterized protein n=1 Tax=viral metagenome TaxID=1070528 RepID=A0A6C0ABR5_9ZZZZ